MNNPRIHLAIDNCFAGKRWTEPLEWANVIRPMGLQCVEASADNECDPLYSDPGYLEDWIGAVESASRQTGVKVVNLYSGHGTYTALGFGSADSRNRERILNQWLKVMVKLASRLGAGGPRPQGTRSLLDTHGYAGIHASGPVRQTRALGGGENRRLGTASMKLASSR